VAAINDRVPDITTIHDALRNTKEDVSNLWEFLIENDYVEEFREWERKNGISQYKEDS